jgi:hypothetical protein
MASELNFYQVALTGHVKEVEGYICTYSNCTAIYSEISDFIGIEGVSSSMYIMLEGVRGDLRVGDRFVAFGYICPDGSMSTYHGGSEIYKTPLESNDQVVAGYLKRFSDLKDILDERRNEVVMERRSEACERTMKKKP